MPPFSTEHRAVLFAQPSDVVVTYCREFCGTSLAAWSTALAAVRKQNPAAYTELLAPLIDIFTLQEFVSLLPKDAALSTYVPYLWKKVEKDASQQLLHRMVDYISNKSV